MSSMITSLSQFKTNGPCGLSCQGLRLVGDILDQAGPELYQKIYRYMSMYIVSIYNTVQMYTRTHTIHMILYPFGMCCIPIVITKTFITTAFHRTTE